MSCDIQEGELNCRQLLTSFVERKIQPEQFEYDTQPTVVYQSKDMGAALAEPKMLHAMVIRQGALTMTRVVARAIRPKSEKLPAF